MANSSRNMPHSQPSIKGDFNTSYTAANISKSAAPYDSTFFNNLKVELDDSDPSYLRPFSYALLSVMFCAQRRGDLVGPWFQDLIANEKSVDPREVFKIIREAIVVAYPFIGLPNCVPACFGLVGVLRELEIDINEDRRRATVLQEDFLTKGLDTRQKIYRGVGNPEVHWMLQKYFPDMTYATDTFIFGYLATGSLDIFQVRQTELIIAASIIAMGATRQSRSHCKASIQLGNSEEVVSALVDTARQIADWNGQPLSDDIIVASLAEELKSNLANDETENEGPNL